MSITTVEVDKIMIILTIVDLWWQSKKRGLSLEEKREKMLQIFYDSQDFFLVSAKDPYAHFLLLDFFENFVALKMDCHYADAIHSNRGRQ